MAALAEVRDQASMCDDDDGEAEEEVDMCEAAEEWSVGKIFPVDHVERLDALAAVSLAEDEQSRP